MKVSDKMTRHILVKAHSNSEWDSCEFAIITISEKWKEEQFKRLEIIKSFAEDYVFQSLNFYDGSVNFYQTKADGLYDLDELLADKDWVFVELNEEELDNLIPPESILDCYTLTIYRDGDAKYKAYGKHTDEEFWTENLPLKQLTSNGSSKNSSAPVSLHYQKVTETLDMLVEILNEWWSFLDYKIRQSITDLTDHGFNSLDDHDKAMNNYWRELPIEQKITLWRQFTTTKETNPDSGLIKKIYIHLHNLRQIDQYNELSMIFWNEQCRGEINIEPWISEWHACECDFIVWYAKLPTWMQIRVINYYRTHLKD